MDVIDSILLRHGGELPNEEEVAAEEVDIPLKARRRIRIIHQLLDEVDLYQLLGLSPTADLKEIRRAYFRRSKEFHPDRYFNRKTGDYHEMLKNIFKRVSGAYRILENNEHRQNYMLRVSQSTQQTPILWQKRKQGETGDAKPWKPKPKSRGGIQERQSDADMAQSTDGSTYRFVRRQRTPREKTSSGDKGSGDNDEQKESSGDPGDHELHAAKESPLPGDNLEPKAGKVDTGFPAAESADQRFDPEEKSSSIMLNVSRDHSRLGVGKLVQPRLAYQRGLQLLEDGDMRAALASLRVAISFSPENAEYRKTYDEAVAHTRNNSADAYFERGQLEHAAGHLEVAYGLICKAASLEPHMQFLLKAAQVGHQMGDLLAAQAYAKRAVEKQPYSKDAHLMMARILLASGRVEEAQSELDTVLEMDSNNAEAKDLAEQLASNNSEAK